MESKRLKKYMILLLIIIFIAAGSSNLGNVNDLSPMEAADKINISSDGKTILKYAQWSVPLMVVVENAIKEYNEENFENIQVELLIIPRSSYNDTINMLLSSGEGPDVFEARSEWLYSYIYKNWIYELTDEIDESFRSEFPDWLKKVAFDTDFQNHIYSIPSSQVTYRLIYNKDLFKMAGLDPEKPPKNLEELASYAKKITDLGTGNRIYGFALPANDIWSGFIQPMEAANYYSNIYIFNNKNGLYDLTGYKQWFKIFMDMKDNGIIFPGEMTMKEDLALLQFAEGNVGMMFIQNWGPVLLEDLFSINCDWGVAMPPAINKDVKEKGYVGIDLSGWQVINKKTKNLKKSVAFWKYLYSKDYNSKLYQDGCLLPVIDGIITDTNNQPDLKNFGQFIPGSKDSVYPLTPLDIDEVNRANIYRSIFDGLSPLESGLSNESARLNMLLDKYQIMGKVNINDYVNPAISHELP